VGGIDYKRDQFDVISQGKRQPGSSFKPIVYFAAFDTATAR
jgi:penicillin-binding protein 1A